MVDQPIPQILDDEFLDAVTEFQADAVNRQNWTDLRMVKLGAYAPDGVYRVKVPTAYRRYQAEVYYTELDGSGMGTCINTIAPNYRNLEVKIGHPPDDKDRWHVQGRVIGSQVNPVTSQPGVPDHSEQHGARNIGRNGAQTTGHVGSDIVLIDDRQMWQLGIFPYSGMQARIVPGWVEFGGKRSFYDGTILADQTANIPAGAGDAAWVLVELDKDLSLTYTKGTEFKWATQNSQTDYVPVGADNTYKWALLMRNGDTSFNYSHLWTGLHFRQVTGIIRTAIAAAANTTGPGVYEIDTSGGALTLTLDTDDAVDGREIIVKDVTGDANANNITIDTEGAETIDGAVSQTISADYGYMRLYSDGSDWFIIG